MMKTTLWKTWLPSSWVNEELQPIIEYLNIGALHPEDRLARHVALTSSSIL